MASTFWIGRVVLLTGATGFLGGALAERLLAAGAHVVAVVRRERFDSRFYMQRLDRLVKVECGDVADAAFMQGVFDGNDVQTVFHTAYGADVNRVLTEPLECFRGNVQSTWQILELVRTTRPDCTMVISSSDKAYGSQDLPLIEDQALRPVHPYEVAKASQDLVAQSYGKVFGLSVAVTRCGNFFGPYDFNATRLVPGTLKTLSTNGRPTLRSDGRATRDFLYIDDAAEAQMMLAEQLAYRPELHGEPFNFSYGMRMEVRELVQRLMRLSGRDDEPIVGTSRTAEIAHLQLDSQKARSVLGWKPSTGFDEALAHTVQWYRDYFSGRMSAI